jgi:hypothetical protein
MYTAALGLGDWAAKNKQGKQEWYESFHWIISL